MRARPPNNLPHDSQIHRVMRLGIPHRDMLSEFINIAPESVAEVHIAVFINVPVLARGKNEGLLSMSRFGEIH